MTGLLITIVLGAFNADATTRALGHSDGRSGALEQFFKLPRADLMQARKSSIGPAITRVALDPKTSYLDRILALRVIALLNLESQSANLVQLLRHTPSPEGIAVARETAKTLFKLGAGPFLTAALGHGDPEVRKYAARAGAGGAALCPVLLSDPWPMVRAAAAEGLAIHEKQAPCLRRGFKDRSESVLRAVIDSTTQLGMSQVGPELRTIVRNPSNSISLRADALYGLGRLGLVGLAKKVLKNHMAHGGMTELAAASIRGLSAAASPSKAYLAAMKSPSTRVLLALARALASRPDSATSKRLRHIRKRLKPRYQETIDRLLKPLSPPPRLGEVIQRDAPEDVE